MYVLPEELRNELREPLEKIISEEDLKKLEGSIISVGDEVTLTLYEHNIVPKLCIVDYKTRRGKISEKKKQKIKEIGEEVISVKNPSRSISDELWNAIKESIDSTKKTRIEVEGEEDLAALPCIYLSKENTKVLYGIPDKGIALVTVNEKNKKVVSEFLSKMKRE